MLLLLIIPGLLKGIFAIAGLLSVGILLFLLYRLLLGPALNARADIDSPPPEEGYSREIVLDQERTRTITIGQVDSDITTRMQGIKEDHLVIRLDKERELEEYAVTLSPGGAVYWIPPHSKKTEPLKGVEVVDSREIIGHPLSLRIAAAVRDNRPVQYLEFSLSTEYFFNTYGEEKMKFKLTMVRIVPPLDVNSRNKQGLYMFGRGGSEHERESEGDEGSDHG